MSTFFGRTGASDFPDQLKVLITGPPKAGKTTLLGTVPNIVIADTEPHANNLQSLAHLDVPFKTITSSSDLETFLMILSDDALRSQAAASLGMPAIEAVAIDTLDTYQAIMKRDRLRQEKRAKFQRDDWGWLKEELAATVAAFTALPMHVFFVVHSKTKDIGDEDNPNTILLPALEGAMGEAIAGMVGYSLYSFRRPVVQPDGTSKTEYFLRTEGDDTYGFVGNRAGGRLPEIIRPDFADLLQYANAGKKQAQEAASTPVADFQPGRGVPAPRAAVTVQQAPPAAPAAIPAPQQPQAAPEPSSAPAPAATPQSGTDEGDPVNVAALSHIKKVYDAIGVPFPEQHVTTTKTLGEARLLVRMWRAAQEDKLNGRTEEDPVAATKVFMESAGWIPEGGPASGPVASESDDKPVIASVDGTIDQVMAYASDDLQRIQEAYDLEVRRDKPRKGLLEKLIAKGANPRAAEAAEEAANVQTPVQTPAPPQPAPTPPAAPSAQVTQPAEAADSPATETQAVATQAVALVQEELGGEVVEQREATEEETPCEQCGGLVDDLDIARLSKVRFKRWLCVNDYIQAIKAV